MKLEGERAIPAPRARVWAALNDPAALEACIPGVESLEKRSDTEFAATVAARIGPVNARFRGVVKLSDIDPPNGYRISGEGTGGAAGFARGAAAVRLADAEGGATRLVWEADAQVGGRLAQIGSRLVGAAARRLAGEFFDALSEHVAAAEPAPEDGAPAPTPTSRLRRLLPWAAAAAAVLAAAALLLSFAG